MRVLICPDEFGGTIGAASAASAIAEGWRAVAGDRDELTGVPMSDGGPGFVEVLAARVPGERVPVRTVDPLGRPVTGEILLAGSVAYVESADACGLDRLADAERDPRLTGTAGVADLIMAGYRAGAGRIVIGLGGSGTNDAGAGMLAGLGVVPVDRAGKPLPAGGAALIDCAAVTGSCLVPAGVELVAATDVDSELVGPKGATAVFGRQKGLPSAEIGELDRALGHFAGVLCRDLEGCPSRLAELPGAGAAGGLGAAILAIGGSCTPGGALVRQLTGLDEAIARADLVITGEGRFDAQSLRGKVVSSVASRAAALGTPCVVVAGRVALSRELAVAAGVAETHSLVELCGVEEAVGHPDLALAQVGRRLAARWSGEPGS